jgi:hypothetical protein
VRTRALRSAPRRHFKRSQRWCSRVNGNRERRSRRPRARSARALPPLLCAHLPFARGSRLHTGNELPKRVKATRSPSHGRLKTTRAPYEHVAEDRSPVTAARYVEAIILATFPAPRHEARRDSPGVAHQRTPVPCLLVMRDV